jgi:very-short-patch-repair endonuclease
MSFEKEHERWIEQHAKQRKGERLRRLREGHGHAEQLFLKNVWHPAFRHFEHLHPEYEVRDFRDGNRYLDFAYIKHPFFACFEIDGYGPHWRDLDRRKFTDHLNRQNHLVLDGWKVLRFSYDEVVDKPRNCQQLIQQFIGRWLGSEASSHYLSPEEKEILRLAARKQSPITIREAASQIGCGDRHTRTLLRTLADKKLLAPARGSIRIRSYRLASTSDDILF